MKKIFIIIPVTKIMAMVLFALVFLVPLSARSEIKAGSFEVTPYVGYNLFDDGQNLKDSPVYGGRLGYNITKYFGIEGTLEYIHSRVDDRSISNIKDGRFSGPWDDVDVTFYHLDLVLNLFPDSKITPFIVAGYGAGHYSPQISNHDVSVIDFGAGVKFWVSEHVAIRFDIRDSMATEVFDDTYHNVAGTVGLVFAFGGKSNEVIPVKAEEPPPPPPPPPPIVKEKKCPNTPQCCIVDEDGCPTDSDKDGVCDGCDKCPDTPAGVAVDKDGCPIPPPVVEEVKPQPRVVKEIMEKGRTTLEVLFDFDKSVIKKGYYSDVDNLVSVMKQYPDLNVAIEGHTDSKGTAEYNKKLSQRRADAVKKYMVERGGIDSNRLHSHGFGLEKPIVSNKTREGRAKNRRVEAVANYLIKKTE